MKPAIPLASSQPSHAVLVTGRSEADGGQCNPSSLRGKSIPRGRSVSASTTRKAARIGGMVVPPIRVNLEISCLAKKYLIMFIGTAA